MVHLKQCFLQIGKILGEEWKALTDAKRVPFEKIAATEKTRYAAELEAYKFSKAEESIAAEKELEEKVKLERVQALQLFKQKEKTDQAKKLMKDLTKEKKKAKEQAQDPNKPKKPLSSYLIFSMEMRKILDEEKPGLSFAEMNALIALKWKEISDKQIWNDKAAVAKERYTADMEEYNKAAVMT
jgi:upstream-binding transcription factor